MTDKSMAQEFAEGMAEVAHDADLTADYDAQWNGKYKLVKFMNHGGKRGLRFTDKSKLFLGKEGTLILPVEGE